MGNDAPRRLKSALERRTSRLQRRGVESHFQYGRHRHHPASVRLPFLGTRKNNGFVLTVANSRRDPSLSNVIPFIPAKEIRRVCSLEFPVSSTFPSYDVNILTSRLAPLIKSSCQRGMVSGSGRCHQGQWRNRSCEVSLLDIGATYIICDPQNISSSPRHEEACVSWRVQWLVVGDSAATVCTMFASSRERTIYPALALGGCSHTMMGIPRPV
ncbi:hypothetical protein N657DRAFT_408649 [Parathielavia appendiculata]|uniref:Uncharacterized protein n=1 Tax=Parathielavia appendiculata TaxID=2587402 RepID=A0AAN6TZ81_9PEZI|nr:hypothetical protein N657DRAFT_408649 [Parathielavia appendiculata]